MAFCIYLFAYCADLFAYFLHIFCIFFAYFFCIFRIFFCIFFAFFRMFYICLADSIYFHNLLHILLHILCISFCIFSICFFILGIFYAQYAYILCIFSVNFACSRVTHRRAFGGLALSLQSFAWPLPFNTHPKQRDRLFTYFVHIFCIISACCLHI